MFVASPFRSRWYIWATIGLMLLVIPGGWLLVKWHEIEVQRDAVEEIRRAGGSVIYGEPQRPEWLPKFVGDNWFTEVEQAYCGSLTTDADLEHLKRLIQLQVLTLDDTKISDAGLEHLKGLVQLRELLLTGPTITDAGLEHLTGLAQIESLWLDGTKITDAGLKHLKGLAQLEHLWLRGTKITDGGLEHLKGLTNLQVLDLTHTQVTDTGVKRLQAALPHCHIRH